MSAHRITYDIIGPGRYRAPCRCGKSRESTNTDVLSVWGPEHVVSAYERERAR